MLDNYLFDGYSINNNYCNHAFQAESGHGDTAATILGLAKHFSILQGLAGGSNLVRTYIASKEDPMKLYVYIRSPALQLSVTLKSQCSSMKNFR